MREKKRILELSDWEHRILFHGWNEYRNSCIEQGLPTEDIDAMFIKIHEAPTRKEIRRSCREER